MKKPDENTVKRWLEGGLDGEELSNIESWAEVNSGELGELDAEFKCDIGWNALNDEMIAEIPVSIEPPYPEFFNSKMLQAIGDDAKEAEVSEQVKPVNGLWQKVSLMIAPAAVAALVAFYAGTQMQNADPVQAKDASVLGSIYVPNSGIEANVSESLSATEIILSGLAPISDDLDIAAGDTSPGLSPMMASTHKEIIPHAVY